MSLSSSTAQDTRNGNGVVTLAGGLGVMVAESAASTSGRSSPRLTAAKTAATTRAAAETLLELAGELEGVAVEEARRLELRRARDRRYELRNPDRRDRPPVEPGSAFSWSTP